MFVKSSQGGRDWEKWVGMRRNFIGRVICRGEIRRNMEESLHAVLRKGAIRRNRRGDVSQQQLCEGEKIREIFINSAWSVRGEQAAYRSETSGLRVSSTAGGGPDLARADNYTSHTC